MNETDFKLFVMFNKQEAPFSEKGKKNISSGEDVLLEESTFPQEMVVDMEGDSCALE